MSDVDIEHRLRRSKPYDVLYEALADCEEKPYAILLGHRDWWELRQDPRALQALRSCPGDPDTFLGVPVRIMGRRNRKGSFQPRLFATAQDMHDELGGR